MRGRVYTPEQFVKENNPKEVKPEATPEATPSKEKENAEETGK